jgi:ribosomal protein L16 Arg81 hydroxylase
MVSDQVKQLFQQNTSPAWISSPEWWRGEFLEATRNGVEPYLFKKILPNEFPGPEEITNVFRLMQEMRDVKKAHIRIYIGEEKRDDLVEKAVKSQFATDELLPDFMARLTGEKRFSLVLNRLQDWSEILTASVGSFLQSMFAQRGIPLGGSEMVVFAGNYAGTAFGVHRGFEHAFLIHLGPGKKEFHCWSEQLYEKLTGSLEPTFGDYEYLISSSEKFVLEPGDVLYLPALVFHVGRQDDFSVSVACPLYTYPIQRLLKQVFSTLVEQIPFDETGTSPHQNFTFSANPLQGLASSFARSIFADWMQTKIPTVLDDYWFRLISNGGFDLSQTPVDEAGYEVGLVSPMCLEANTTLRLKIPYKICWSNHNCDAGDVRVFLRGHAVTVPYSDEMIKLFKHLNDGYEETLNVSESLIKNLQKISEMNGFEIV